MDARRRLGRDEVIDRGIGGPHPVGIDQPGHHHESVLSEAAQLFDG